MTNVTVELVVVSGRLWQTEQVFVLGYPWGYLWWCDKCHIEKA